jgi:hypothetical protein
MINLPGPGLPTMTPQPMLSPASMLATMALTVHKQTGEGS